MIFGRMASLVQKIRIQWTEQNINSLVNLSFEVDSILKFKDFATKKKIFLDN
jgi:hypothetical protein